MDWAVKSKWQMIVVGLLASFILSLPVSIWNFYSYYESRGNRFKEEAQLIQLSIKNIIRLNTGAGDIKLKQSLQRFIDETQKNIFVTRSTDNNTSWKIGREFYVDLTRTLLREQQEFESGGNRWVVEITWYNRPPIYNYLFNAVTFSYRDWKADPVKYRKNRYLRRSGTLWFSFAVSLCLVFSMLYIFRQKHLVNVATMESLQNEKYQLMIKNEKLSDNINQLKLEKSLLAEMRTKVFNELENNQDMVTKIEYQLAEAQQRIESFEQQQKAMSEDKASIENELTKFQQSAGRNAHIVYFEPNQVYTMHNIQDVLKLNRFLEDNDAVFFKYSDRYFFTYHIDVLTNLVDGKWLNKNLTSIEVTVPIDPCKEDRYQKQSDFDTKISNYKDKYPKFKVKVSDIDKRNFMHMRKLEISRTDGIKYNLLFDVGMDFVRLNRSGYVSKQKNYVVIEEEAMS